MEQSMMILNFLCRTEKQALPGASECLARLRFPVDELQIAVCFFFPGYSPQDLFTH